MAAAAPSCMPRLGYCVEPRPNRGRCEIGARRAAAMACVLQRRALHTVAQTRAVRETYAPTDKAVTARFNKGR